MDIPLTPIVPELDITGFGSLYYFELKSSFFHPAESHDLWEMVYVDDGTLHAEADMVPSLLQKGQMIFHRPGEIHAHKTLSQEACNILVVSFASSSPLMKYFSQKIFTLEKKSQKILSLFLEEGKNALGEIPCRVEDKSPLDFSCARQGSVQLMQCYLVELLFSLIRSDEASILPVEHPAPSGRTAETALTGSIEDYILNHLYDPASLEPLCQEFSMSRTYLCRVFKEGTGRSPIDFWIELKIKEAKKLIRQDEQNITQISELLGYASIHHFSRMFKRLTGMSPTAYKNSVGQSADQ